MHDDLKQKVLALLREQQSKNRNESAALRVLEMLVESELTIDLVGTITDEVGELFFYILRKEALLTEFSGGIFSFLTVHRIRRVDPAFALYMAHKKERVCAFLQEELELAYKRILHALLMRENEGVGEDVEDV